MKTTLTALMPRTAVSAASLLLLAGAAWAQTPPPADGQWRGTGGAAVSATSGNSSTQAVLLNAEMARATAADKITLGGAINYGRSKADGVTSTTANKWNGAGQYDFNLSPALFAFGKLGLEGDQLTDLSLRSTLAGGLGYKLIDTPDLKFTLSGGLGYSTDRYDALKTIGGKTAKGFSRASLYLAEESEHQLSKTTSFKQRLELFPGVSGDKAMLARFSAGLGVAMSGTMSLSLGVTSTYNSKPAAGSKKNDLGVFTGLNLKFGAS